MPEFRWRLRDLINAPFPDVMVMFRANDELRRRKLFRSARPGSASHAYVAELVLETGSTADGHWRKIYVDFRLDYFGADRWIHW